jgi:HSP20 family protein
MMIRWQPFDRTDYLRRQIDDVFNELTGRSTEQADMWWQPAIELIDTPDDLQLRAELPGISRDDLDIQATRDAVMITGGRAYPKQGDRQTWLRSEFTYGKFRRLINLPTEINPDQIQANFHDGVLTLTLPKADYARRRVVKIDTNELSSASEPQALDVASKEVVNGTG